MSQGVNISELNRIAALVKLDETTKYGIANCFGVAAAEIEEVGYSSTVENNKTTYSAICNEEVLQLLTVEKNSSYIQKAIERNIELAPVLNKPETGRELLEIMAESLGSSAEKFRTADQVRSAIALFGSKSTTDASELTGGEKLNGEELTDKEVEFIFDDLEVEEEMAKAMGVTASNMANMTKDEPEEEFDSLENLIAAETNKALEEEPEEELEPVDIFGENGELEPVETPVETETPVERSGLTPESVELSEEEDEAYDMDARSYTKRVMDSYDILYSVGYELEKPYGVLVKEGAIVIKRGKPTLMPIASLVKMYSFIANLLKSNGSMLVQSTIDGSFDKEKMMSPDFRVGTNYYPEMQLLIAMGSIGGKTYNTWNEARNVVYDNVRSNIRNCMKREDVPIDTFINAMLTSIVITSFDPEVGIRLRLAVGDYKISSKNVEVAFNKNKANLFTGTGEIIRCEDAGLSTIELDIAFDKKIYLNKPMMAYEAVASMQKNNKPLGISHMILGEQTNGKMLVHNMDTAQASIVLITAGQRSGKGVLTLNMLGTVISDSCPVVYADCKPDMSRTIREIAAKNGKKAAAWDANENYGLKATNVPRVVEEGGMAKAVGVIMYMKLVQLMVVVSKLRRTGTPITEKRPFFIFDEILAVQAAIKATTNVADEIRKDKEADPVDKSWVGGYMGWLKSIGYDLQSATLSEIPSAKMSTIWLNQQVQINAWKSASGVDGINPFEKVVNGTMATKLLGKETFGSEAGLMNVKADEEIKTFIDAKNFALAKTQKIGGRGDITVFKPYLVLNYSENGSDTAEEFRKVVGPEVWRKMAPNGELNQGAGLQGFINMMGDNGINNIDLGYKFLEDVMRITGLSNRYNSVEEYLYDCSVESFFNTTKLTKGLDNDVNGTPGQKSDGVAFGFNSSNGENKEPERKPNPLFTPKKDIGNGSEEEFDFSGKAPSINNPDDLAAFVKASGGEVVSRGGASNIDAVRQANQQGLDFMNAMRQRENSMINRVQTGDNMEQQKVIRGDEAFDFDDEYEAGEDGQQVKQGENGVNWSENRGSEYKHDPKPGFTPNNTHVVTEKSGKYGTILELSPDNGVPVIQLDLENSLVAHMSDYSGTARLGQSFIKTVQGARYNFNDRWKAMLAPAKRLFGSDAMVVKAKILERELYLNDRLVIPIGITGGPANLDVVDICNFKMTFKKFKNLKELILDKELFGVLQTEMPNTYEKAFKTCPSLQVIEVIAAMPNGDSTVITRRGFFNNKREADRAMQMQRDAQKLNQYEAMTATKNPSLANKPIGYRKRAWDSCSAFAGKSIGGARDQLTRTDKSGGFRTQTAGLVLLSAGAVLIGGVGFLFGGVADMIKHFGEK